MLHGKQEQKELIPELTGTITKPELTTASVAIFLYSVQQLNLNQAQDGQVFISH